MEKKHSPLGIEGLRRGVPLPAGPARLHDCRRPLGHLVLVPQVLPPRPRRRLRGDGQGGYSTPPVNVRRAEGGGDGPGGGGCCYLGDLYCWFKVGTRPFTGRTVKVISLIQHIQRGLNLGTVTTVEETGRRKESKE